MKYNFENLEVYNHAEELIASVYQLTNKLPRSEQFGLSDQIRRAVVSIALNIAEGSIGRSKKDFVRYITTAIGSLLETKSALMIAIKLGFISERDLESISPKFDELFFKLIALKKSLHA